MNDTQEIKSEITFESAFTKLRGLHQDGILKFWDILTVPQRTELLEQIFSLNQDTFEGQKKLIFSQNEPESSSFIPFLDYKSSGSKENFILGKQLIADGKVGCLVIAGGQGTRLQFQGPKGMYPISQVRHKSLFQLVSEKTIAASKQAQRPLPLAIMTSPLNQEQTHDFFYRNRFFGLLPDQLTLFSQKMLPFLSQSGDLFLESPEKIAQGPDGNGYSLHHFVESGIYDRWKEKGIHYVNFILVDNPLADPFDAELIGFHHRNQADVTLKATLRENVDEKVGILVKEKDQIFVREYSEFPLDEQKATLNDGSLKHRCANLSLFCFSMDFIKEFSKKSSKLPLHKALKPAIYFSIEKSGPKAEMIKAWKYEYFIFDVLAFSKKTGVLVYPREKCFAPLKNHSGESSPETVRRSLQELDRLTFSTITGKPVSESKTFELAQDFYYPTPALFKKWRGKALPEKDYIDP